MLRVVSTGDTITYCCSVSIIAFVISATMFSDSIKLPKKKLIILVIVSVMEGLRGRLQQPMRTLLPRAKTRRLHPQQHAMDTMTTNMVKGWPQT